MNTYQENKKLEKLQKTREILKELPPFVSDFFRGINASTAYNTQYAYALDIRTFFYFLDTQKIYIKEVEDLDKITPRDLEVFLEFSNYYERNGKFYTNGKRGKGRKIATLRKFYEYYFKRELIHTNPTLIIEKPKIPEKAILALEANQIADLLDIVEQGRGMSPAQLRHHERVKKRDLAIVSLLVGTGMRVSECVGVDLNDVDFNQNAIRATVKGQNERFIYFNREVERAIKDYLEERGKDDNPALFVTRDARGVRRIGLRTIQYMVEKYSKIAIGEGISPHKLRSSFATGLWETTGDIGLVAECLGHKDVNTTRKHYAKAQEERKKRAATSIVLRG